MKNHYCYIVRAGKYCKIGYSRDIYRRIAKMQVGNPQHIELVCLFPFDTEKAARAKEKSLHYHFRKSRVHGEWFKNFGVISALRRWGNIEDRRQINATV